MSAPFLSHQDCATCGPKVTSKDDVSDVEIPLWKKKALSKGLDDVNAAPFGMSDWKTETSISASVSTSAAVGAKDDTREEGGGRDGEKRKLQNVVEQDNVGQESLKKMKENTNNATAKG